MLQRRGSIHTFHKAEKAVWSFVQEAGVNGLFCLQHCDSLNPIYSFRMKDVGLVVDDVLVWSVHMSFGLNLRGPHCLVE